jgi:uncharacterized protein YcbK (DUF882 family)
MGDISKHFSRYEFRCKCKPLCGMDTIDAETLTVLEQIREHFDKPIRITSAFRCFDHNLAVGGSFDSQHTKGRAADIQIEDTTPDEVYAFIDSLYPNKYGVGLYTNGKGAFVHVDTRAKRARW